MRITQIGSNRITSFDHMVVTYLNEERYDGENLHEFYDRIVNKMSPLFKDKRGVNITKQGILNHLATSFNLERAHCEYEQFFYLSNNPIDFDPITGNVLPITVIVNGVTINRLSQHPNNTYDSAVGLTNYAFTDSYLYRSTISKISNSGFIIWRNYDGTLSDILEITYPITSTGISIGYSYYDSLENKPRQIVEEFEVNDNIITSNYDIIPIDESNFYVDGDPTEEVDNLVIEYLLVSKRHWGYATIDEAYISSENLEMRRPIRFFNSISNSGGQ